MLWNKGPGQWFWKYYLEYELLQDLVKIASSFFYPALHCLETVSLILWVLILHISYSLLSQKFCGRCPSISITNKQVVSAIYCYITSNLKISWLKIMIGVFFLQFCGLARLVRHRVSADFPHIAAFSWSSTGLNYPQRSHTVWGIGADLQWGMPVFLHVASLSLPHHSVG